MEQQRIELGRGSSPVLCFFDRPVSGGEAHDIQNNCQRDRKIAHSNHGFASLPLTHSRISTLNGVQLEWKWTMTSSGRG